MSKLYNDFIEAVREINYLRSAEGLLMWDPETFMPRGGIEDRSKQLAALSTIIHQKLTSRRITDMLKDLQSGKVYDTLSLEQQANIREVAWEHHRASALPTELVTRLAKTKSLSSNKWIEAKKKSDFSLFAPYLSEILEIKKQEADAIGHNGQPYDALLDEFEPGLKTSQVTSLFASLRDKLIPIVSRIIDSGKRPDISFLSEDFPVDAQKNYNFDIARQLGFNFERGRIDESMHPFTSGGLHDTRFTTKYDPQEMRFALFATIHETGHALYEQGYLDEHYATPMGQAVSYGIHESQSRMWENIIGRSLPFWKYHYPGLRETFPEQLGRVDVNDFHAAVNDVHPSLIRVEADEVTYNLHILLRFEMETALLNNELQLDEAPQVWNEKMDTFLKIDVPDDANGVLQDIHWSLGYFGYFPTYTLGNLYAAQFYQQMNTEIPDLDEKIEQGQFNVILNWLREKIHVKGKFLRANDLVNAVTNKDLDENIFIGYLKEKYSGLY